MNRKTSLAKAFLLPFLAIAVICGCRTSAPVEIENGMLKRELARTIPAECKTLTLDDAVQIALANNPDYASTLYSFRAARARFYQKLAEHLPTVTAGYTQTEYYYTPTASGGTGDKNIYTKLSGNIEANWLIFDGLVRTMESFSKLHESRQYEAMNRDSRRLLVESVTKAYNDVLLASEGIKIAKADREFNARLLKEAEIKFEAGASASSDVLNFKIKVNNADLTLIAEEYSYKSSRYVLAALMGFTESDLPQDLALAELEPLKAGPSLSIQTCLENALANRPDLQAYREALDSARYDRWAKWGEFLPNISAFVNRGYARNNPHYDGRYDNQPRGQDKSFNYGLTGNWEIFSGGKNLAALKESYANLEKAEQDLVAKWISVVNEVRQAYDSYEEAAKLLSLYEDNDKLTKQTRDLVEQEYKAGNTTLTRVNEVQKDVVDAETGLISARIKLKNSKTQLDTAIGDNEPSTPVKQEQKP